MKNKIILALIVPVAAFIVSCGPVDMQDGANFNVIDSSAVVGDHTIDATAGLNLSEEAKNDWWLGLYIPAAFSYYRPPFFWGSYYPNPVWDWGPYLSGYGVY